MHTVTAVDVDLHRITAWSDPAGIQCVHADLATALSVIPRGMVLIEISGPILYRDAHHKKTLAWMIWNAATVTRLADAIGHEHVLVAPSSQWTLGYPLDAREALANVTFGPLYGNGSKVSKAQAHDINECRAMVAMYRRRPDKWVPLEKFLAAL
jgi:hypothetical protein